jgi:hypothetical protein
VAGTDELTEVDVFLGRALDGGPVFMDLHSNLYYFLVPGSFSWRWNDRDFPGVECLGQDRFLGVPDIRLTVPRGRSYWCVPMNSPGELCNSGDAECFVRGPTGRARVRELGGDRGGLSARARGGPSAQRPASREELTAAPVGPVPFNVLAPTGRLRQVLTAWGRGHLAEVPAGLGFDVLLTPGAVAEDTVRRMRAAGRRVGPVILGPSAAEFILERGSAPRWSAPRSILLRPGSLGAPPAAHGAPPGDRGLARMARASARRHGRAQWAATLGRGLNCP